MNDRERQFHREIDSLQNRLDQLTSTITASARVLDALATRVQAALAAEDATAAARLARQIAVVRRRDVAVSNEINTLQELIDARRRVGGSATPGF